MVLEYVNKAQSKASTCRVILFYVFVVYLIMLSIAQTICVE
jgi:hypothetical protein